MIDKSCALSPQSRFLLVLALGCLSILSAVPAIAAPNILLLIGDDMGLETLSCFEVGTDFARTPNLDSLCREGVRFQNAWSQPVCSPTRATMMTGRFGFRTGVGAAIPYPKEVANRRMAPPKPRNAPREADAREHDEIVPGLRLDEFTLAQALKSDAASAYETAAIGKWHLADLKNGVFDHPNRAGFDYFAGDAFGPLPSYFAFPKQVNGQPTDGVVGYADSVKVDDAIAWLGQREAGRPWFIWLGFNNPHSPHHLPPLRLLNSAVRHLDPQSDDVIERPLPYFKAMLEALDSEIGRLLGSLTAEQRTNTYVFFVGDNGTTRQVVQSPFDPQRAKGTVYQGGLNVPLMVAGPGIDSGRASQALVNTVDLYATILELAGIEIESAVPRDVTLDSVSFAPLLLDSRAEPLRDFVYADSFGMGIRMAQAIRNQTHKLLINEGVEEFYALDVDPYEHQNLLLSELSVTALENYQALKARLAELIASE